MKRIFSIISLIACLFALPVFVAADEPLIYNDIRTNASFILPKDWKQASLSKDYDFIDAKFTDPHEPSRIILYSSSDVFSYSTESERNGCTRADYHVDSLLPEDFEGMYGIAHEDIAVVTKGENKYFIFPVTQTQEIYELSLNVTMTCAITMYDGYMYMFQYSGDPKSSGYLDFISVLESADFPKSISSGISPKKTLTYDPKPEESDFDIEKVLVTDDIPMFVGLLAIGIGVTFIVIKLSQWYDSKESKHLKNKPTHTVDEYDDWLAYQNEHHSKPSEKPSEFRKVLIEKLKRYAPGIIWGAILALLIISFLWEEFFQGKSAREIIEIILIYFGVGRITGIIATLELESPPKNRNGLAMLVFLPFHIIGTIISIFYVFFFIPDMFINILIADKLSFSYYRPPAPQRKSPEPEPLPAPAPAPAKPTTADQIAVEEARYCELQEKISRIPAKKVKELYAEGKLTDEQYLQIAKKYNKLRAEMRDIRERIEVLKQIENSKF